MIGRRVVRLIVAIADPRTYLHALRLLNFWHYAHVQPRAQLQLGRAVAISPTVSFRNGNRIRIGDHTHIGEFCAVWAGDASGRITIGEHSLLGPRVLITASNYAVQPGVAIMDQDRREADVVIGDDVWLGAGAIILPGVTVGPGCVVAAGAVVTRDLAPGTIAAGVPARAIGQR